MTKPVLDPFAQFRALTRARIGLGRVGDALPTSALLDFQAAHARARDAVHASVNFDALTEALLPLEPLRVASRAPDRAAYLRRPDWGRKLNPEERPRLAAHAGDYDLAVVIADGLSASAVDGQAVGLLGELRQRLGQWKWAPVVLAEQARVALGDEVGELLGARLVVVMIGERPGLSVSDSLGLYVTWQPRVGRTDAERNCISNIHGDGLSVADAASLLVRLITQAERLGLTGVGLKLNAEPARLGSGTS